MVVCFSYLASKTGNVSDYANLVGEATNSTIEVAVGIYDATVTMHANREELGRRKIWVWV